jgi:hypothetical protein
MVDWKAKSRHNGSIPPKRHIFWAEPGGRDPAMVCWRIFLGAKTELGPPRE